MDGTGFEYVNLLREVNCYAKFIFMGEDIEESITAFRFQAFYYLLRPFREEDLQFLLYRMGKEQGESKELFAKTTDRRSRRNSVYFSGRYCICKQK